MDGRKMNPEGILKRKYVDVFLVFSAVMVLGLLLVISAAAQPDFMTGSGDLSSGGAATNLDNLNQPPKLISLAPDKPGPQVAGTTIIWTAKALDLEHDPVLYRYFLDGQPKTDWSDSPNWTWTTSAADAGSHTIEVRLRDGLHAGADKYDDAGKQDYVISPGAASAAPVPAPVPETPVQQQPAPEPVPVNQPPAIQSLIPNAEGPQVAGTVITLIASASDPDNDPVQYLFLLDGLPKTGWSEDPTWTWTTSASDVGTHSVEVRARDNKHNPDGDDSKGVNFAITAPPNNPPAISSLAPDQASPQAAGAAITWTATASDPENDAVQYLYLLDGQPRTGWSEDPTWTWTTSEADIGTHSVEVRARDNKHNAEGDDSRGVNFVIAVPPNNPPSVMMLSADQASPQAAGAAVTWTAEASDSENDPVQYLFSLDGQPRTEWTENPTWTWTTSEADIGQHGIEVKVRDNKHNPDGDDAKTANFVIVVPPNNPPAISNLASDLASPQVAGAAVTWTATASDPENDPVQYLFSLDGQPRADWTENPTWTWTTSEADIGQHTIEVKVRDNKHNPEGDDARTADFVIAAPPNNPPALSALASDLASPQVAGAAITWTATASDPENDPVQYLFSLDGQPKSRLDRESNLDLDHLRG